jgi:hypothetical protein
LDQHRLQSTHGENMKIEDVLTQTGTSLKELNRKLNLWGVNVREALEVMRQGAENSDNQQERTRYQEREEYNLGIVLVMLGYVKPSYDDIVWVDAALNSPIANARKEAAMRAKTCASSWVMARTRDKPESSPLCSSL